MGTAPAAEPSEGSNARPHLSLTTPICRNFADGANRDRTGDLLLAKQALSQLSYGPRGTDSNASPPATPRDPCMPLAADPGLGTTAGEPGAIAANGALGFGICLATTSPARWRS
jgi:hypothetical protein